MVKESSGKNHSSKWDDSNSKLLKVMQTLLLWLYNQAKHCHFQRLCSNRSAGKTEKLGHSQVRVHVIIWIYSRMLLKRKNWCVKHNLYLNRYQDKCHSGWEGVVLYLCAYFPFVLWSKSQSGREILQMLFMYHFSYIYCFSRRWATCSLCVMREYEKEASSSNSNSSSSSSSPASPLFSFSESSMGSSNVKLHWLF